MSPTNPKPVTPESILADAAQAAEAMSAGMLAAAEAEAKALTEKQAKEAEASAIKAHFDYDEKLANATSLLIRSARELVVSKVTSLANENFATFRKELAPLAAGYGVKIVLIGDKTRAVLVLV